MKRLSLILCALAFSVSFADAQSPTPICFNSTGSGGGQYCQLVDANNPFPVTQTITPGAATAANQALEITALNTLVSQAIAAGTPLTPATATATQAIALGGQYNTTLTALTNGQQGGIPVNSNGALFTTLNQGSNSVRGTVTTTGAGPVTIITAGSGSNKTYVTSIQCWNTSATASVITLSDGASTQLYLPATGGNNATFLTPLVTAAATNFTFSTSPSETTIGCNAQGYYAL